MECTVGGERSVDWSVEWSDKYRGQWTENENRPRTSLTRG